jgi:trans-aconitate methyltransferase
MMADAHYTFGDSDRAAARLAQLADLFEPTSRRWLGAADLRDVQLAVDVGCGPGYTTELVHEVVGARETWGLDASEQLILRARARLGERFAFVVCNAAVSPWPIDASRGPQRVDVAYARHVLAHLADPTAVLVAAAAAVRPGGHMVLEETAALDSPDPVFVSYYAHVRALQRHYGQDTFVGASLDRVASGTPWRVARFEQTNAALDARAMAAVHAMNIRTWSRDAFAAAAFDQPTLAGLTEALDATAAGDRPAPPVAAVVGQAVLVRSIG